MEATNINAVLAQIVGNVDKAKLKDSKEKLATVENALMGYKSPAIKMETAKAMKARTKAALVECLTIINSHLNHILDGGAEYVEDKHDGENQPTSLLDELAIEIKFELEQAQRSFLTVGKKLTEGLGEIKETGGKQSDFLTWAKDACGIKKAQAYKLMSVYKTFGDESDFKGVSMRVLYTLTGQPEKVVEAAREKAKSGVLDTKALDTIILTIDGPKPAAAPTAPANGKPAKKGQEAVDKGKFNPALAPNTVHQMDSMAQEIEQLKSGKLILAPIEPEIPAETELEKDAEIDRLRKALKESQNASIKALKSARTNATGNSSTDESDTVKALQATIDELNKTVANLQAELNEAKSGKKSAVQSMPYLPQFDSESMACRLGIEIENTRDKVKINKAYRALAKIYTATTCPEGAKALKSARDSLLYSLK